MNRARAADDFATIRARMEQLHRKRDGTMAADDFATIRDRLEELRREREAAQPAEGKLYRDPAINRSRSVRAGLSEVSTGPGRVRQSGSGRG